MKANLARLGFLVLVLVVPACGGQKASPTLFSESFNSGFPTSNWTAPVATGSATAVPDFAYGFPAPSLMMSTTSALSSVKTDTTLSFPSPSLTVTFSMVDPSNGLFELGSGSVSLLDATPAVVASATWDNATGLITFHITGGAADATAAATGDFQRLVFNVNSSGTATWSFFGGPAQVTQAGFPAVTLKIELGATFGSGTVWPSFFFDEISVTSP
jgi:hypothetical protein